MIKLIKLIKLLGRLRHNPVAYLALSLLYALAILIFSVVPLNNFGVLRVNGTGMHIVSYFILSAFMLLYFRAKGSSTSKIAAPLMAGFYGFLIELIQYFLPYRHFELADILINFFSAFLALFLYQMYTFRDDGSNNWHIKNKKIAALAFGSIGLVLLAAISAFVLVSDSKLLLLSIILIVGIITFKRIKIGIYAVVFCIPLIPRLPKYFGPANFYISEVILLVVLFNWVLGVLLQKRFEFRKTALDMPILAFFTLTIVSFFFSLKYIHAPFDLSSSASSLYPVKVMLDTVEYLLLFYVITHTLGRNDVKWIIYAAIASFFIVSLASIYQYNYFHNWEQFFGFQTDFRAHATFNNENVLGMYLILYLPMVFYLIRNHIYKFILGLFGIIALLYAGSRGAFFSFFGAMFLTLKKTNRKIILAAVLLIVMAIFFLPALKENRITYRMLNFDDSWRINVFSSSIAWFVKNPAGIGIGSFRLAGVQKDSHHAHNLYIQILLERGIISFFVFIWLLYEIFKQAKVTNQGKLYSIKQGLFAGIIAILIFGMVDYPFYSQQIALLWWINIGLLIVVSRK